MRWPALLLARGSLPLLAPRLGRPLTRRLSVDARLAELTRAKERQEATKEAKRQMQAQAAETQSRG